MSKQLFPEWNHVLTKNQKEEKPTERWGHNFVQVNQREIVTFGGYGGSPTEGKYLDDLWTFDFVKNSWRKVETTGNKPQARSNYTVHFNSQTQQIIMFGGGTSHRIRFNTICILNWETKVWRQIQPSESQAFPWERTYHTSQFAYPYLIVFGGQSLNNIDLNDLWSFNIQTSEWKQINFKDEKDQPVGRRFSSSAFLNGQFYVIGGCTTSNYKCLGNLYRINLTRLLTQGLTDDYQWQLIMDENKLLERWGHSVNVYEQRIFIACGRVNSTTDSNQILVFDPKKETIQVFKTAQKDYIQPRRRPSSIMVGNSLLIFGGYNGQYLNDFNYITLHQPPQTSSLSFKLTEKLNEKQMLSHLSKLQKVNRSDITLNLTMSGKSVLKLKSNSKLLSKNCFFKILLKHSDKKSATVQLPTFSDVLTFRLIHTAILTNQLALQKHCTLQMYEKLLQTSEYFCCLELISTIQSYLGSQVNDENCEHLYNLAFTFSLEKLKKISAQQYLTCNPNFTSLPSKQSNLENPQCPASSNALCAFKQHQPQEISLQSHLYLSSLYKNMRFDLEQNKLRALKGMLSSKKASTTNNSVNNSESISSQVQKQPTNPVENNKKSCFVRLVEFFSTLCDKNKANQEQSHQNEIIMN